MKKGFSVVLTSTESGKSKYVFLTRKRLYILVNLILPDILKLEVDNPHNTFIGVIPAILFITSLFSMKRKYIPVMAVFIFEIIYILFFQG